MYSGPLHIIGALAFLVGFLFLVRLAFKSLSDKQLKTWGISLVVGGILVCLISASMGFGGMRRGFTMMKGPDMMNVRVTHGDMMDGNMMYRNDMMSDDLTELTGDDFDTAFIQDMIDHHEEAIQMANDAKKNAKHAELKTMADNIISAQQAEIDQMKQWQTAWGYAK